MPTLTLKKKTPEYFCDIWLHTLPLFQKHTPMRIGIFEELKIEQRKLKKAKFGWKEIRQQLYHRVRKDWYRAAIKNREPRCNLDGSEVDSELHYFRAVGSKKESKKPLPESD